jgi:orotidine-5'-phosphate decarboxylase
LKLTDVSHIATGIIKTFADEGADGIVVSGICGREVLRDTVAAGSPSCEIWTFTEFTNDSGLIEPALANRSIRVALDVLMSEF